MCIQELIWCNCGHGEFLPIIKCPQAKKFGACWLVVHGDHRMVIEMPCSYCKTGLNKRKPLGSPMPQGDVAKKIENNVSNVQMQATPELSVVDENWNLYAEPEEPSWNLDDVLNCDFGDDFTFGDELSTL